jgi:transposase-like protein
MRTRPEEVKRLKWENETLRKERGVLKRAAAFFATEIAMRYRAI